MSKMSILQAGDLDNLLQQKKQACKVKSCYPCRKRKVRCDNHQPCNNCSKKGYSELCVYNVTSSQVDSVGAAGVGSLQSLPRKRRCSSDAASTLGPAETPRRQESVASTRIPTPRSSVIPQSPSMVDGGEGLSQRPTSSAYLGSNSLPTFFSTESSNRLSTTENDILEQDVSLMLGLHNSTGEYPFHEVGTAKSLEHELRNSLPDDREIMAVFQSYRNIGHPVNSVIVSIEDFESDLCIFLQERNPSRENEANTILTLEKVPISWLSLLYAVLASGYQFSDRPTRERDARAKINVNRAFQCIRLGHYLLHATSQSIQALLLIGNVLQNSMQSEAAWVLLGTTVRLAQSKGLHKENTGAEYDDKATILKRKIWWRAVMQDTLLSLCFDRPSITTLMDCRMPLRPTAFEDGYSFDETIYLVSQLGLELTKRNVSLVSVDFKQILDEVDKADAILSRAEPQLQAKEKCRTIQQHLEFFTLRLHITFVLSVLCRPALSRSADESPEKKLVASKCKQNLIESVQAFLDMHTLSIVATRTWAFVHHGLSSALLLGILGETNTNPRVRRLLGSLIEILSVLSMDEGDKLSKTELSKSHLKALKALQKIYDDTRTASHSSIASVHDGSTIQQNRGTEEVSAGRNVLVGANDEDISRTALKPAIQEQLFPAYDHNSTLSNTAIDFAMDLSPLQVYNSILWDDMEFDSSLWQN